MYDNPSMLSSSLWAVYRSCDVAEGVGTLNSEYDSFSPTLDPGAMEGAAPGFKVGESTRPGENAYAPEGNTPIDSGRLGSTTLKYPDGVGIGGTGGTNSPDVFIAESEAEFEDGGWGIDGGRGNMMLW